MESGLAQDISLDSINSMLIFIKDSMVRLQVEVSGMAETLEYLSQDSTKEEMI